MVRGVIVLAALALAACEDESKGFDSFETRVSRSQVGHAVDHWIEMKNRAGEWERTGLIFGYVDDYDECKKAIAGLKAVNHAREYRCVPAQSAG